jgi:hypothetical protein
VREAIEEAIIRKSKAILADQRASKATKLKYARRFTKRTGSPLVSRLFKNLVGGNSIRTSTPDTASNTRNFSLACSGASSQMGLMSQSRL